MKLCATVILLLTVLTAGCSKEVVDWRNVNVDGGKIFKGGENKPFTGHITNIPSNNLPDPMMGSSIAQQIGGLGINRNMFNAVVHADKVCETDVIDGMVEGPVSCSTDGTVYFRGYLKNGQYVNKFEWADPGKSVDEHPYVVLSAGDDSQIDGKVTFYYANGHVLSAASFNHGKIVGDWDESYDDGSKESHGHFNDNGHKEGVFESWTKDGRLTDHCQWKDGHQDGECKVWNSDGSLATDKIYTNGQVVRDVAQEQRNTATALSNVDRFRSEANLASAPLDNLYRGAVVDCANDTECQQKVAEKLCQGHMTDNPAPGESICAMKNGLLPSTPVTAPTPTPVSNSADASDLQDGPPHSADSD